ncbi:MAG TPA: hypothetical protein VGD78_18160 [Chthoniobacterales bacterium]
MLNLFLDLVSLVSGALLVRDIRRIFVQDDKQPWLYVRLICFAVMTFSSFFVPDPWNHWLILTGTGGVVLATCRIDRSF